MEVSSPPTLLQGIRHTLSSLVTWWKKLELFSCNRRLFTVYSASYTGTVCMDTCDMYCILCQTCILYSCGMYSSHLYLSHYLLFADLSLRIKLHLYIWISCSIWLVWRSAVRIGNSCAMHFSAYRYSRDHTHSLDVCFSANSGTYRVWTGTVAHESRTTFLKTEKN